MRKIIIASIIGITGLMNAQESLVMQYPEELYQYNESGALNGTARYRALSGAMGALGGDLSATMVNPASSAVFLRSEVGFTAGLNMNKVEVNQGNNFNESELKFQQAGGVFVFEDLNSDKWKNISIGMNYQRNAEVNEIIDVASNTEGIAGNEMTRHYTERFGHSSITNINVAANYDHKLYIGGGVNFHTHESNTLELMQVNDVQFNDQFTFIKDFTPNTRTSEGVSLNLGVIGKLNQNIRLAAAYQSPTWYQDTEEVLAIYSMYNATDDAGEYYYISRDVVAYLNDLTTSQKFTGSAAFVIGNSGLISADYTYTDYSPAKYKPENSFVAENGYISNNMSGTSTLRVGGEMRLQDFRLRGGFRYEQSPFDEIDIQLNATEPAESYKPFGDLTGFSVGAGYEFDGFYIDAAYDFFNRDREYLISGNYYDNGGEVDAAGITEDEALNYLSLNAEDSGYGQVIRDIDQKQGNVSLSVGFRF